MPYGFRVAVILFSPTIYGCDRIFNSVSAATQSRERDRVSRANPLLAISTEIDRENFRARSHFFRIAEVIENSCTVARFAGDGTPITEVSDPFIVKPSFVLPDPH
jgi:hypothetical protein